MVLGGFIPPGGLSPQSYVRKVEEYSKEDYSRREERSHNEELIERVQEDEIPNEIKKKVRETYS